MPQNFEWKPGKVSRMVGLGIDVGTSSVKVAVVDFSTGAVLAHATSPSDVELPISVPFSGAAEQDPDSWWLHVKHAILQIPPSFRARVESIGIAYQMHGLVLVNDDGKPIRPSIIWCDSRAAASGDLMESELGESFCATHLLNRPGNFTLAKHRWVINHEGQTGTVMLPGDYVAFKLSGRVGTSDSGASEMIAWDFVEHRAISLLATQVSPALGTFAELLPAVADELGLPHGAKIAYRAGDQPNNAVAVGVHAPGQTAATAGTSGVLYAIADRVEPGLPDGVNRFLHPGGKVGTLMCVNGCGSAYAWLRRTLFPGQSYPEMNAMIEAAHSDDLLFFPFGNGSERILNLRSFSGFHGLDFARHGAPEIGRAVLEGIIFAFALGAKQMEAAGSPVIDIRAANANLFKFELFGQLLSNQLQVLIELVDADGAVGAARGGFAGATGYPIPSSPSLKSWQPTAEPLKKFEKWRDALFRNVS
jgi:xylulokinase